MNVYEAGEYQDTSLSWLCHIVQKTEELSD